MSVCKYVKDAAAVAISVLELPKTITVGPMLSAATGWAASVVVAWVKYCIVGRRHGVHHADSVPLAVSCST